METRAILSCYILAFDVGFGDLSNFNRTFRQRYEATPGAISQSALKADHPRR
jgi:AraC-like DNA-binding protein